MTDVHIVAVGARTPVGLTAESSAAAVRARISRIREHPFMVDMRGEPVRVARDEQLDPLLAGSDRMLRLASTALRQVVGKMQAAAGPWQSAIPLFLGTAGDRFAWDESTTSRLVRTLGTEPSFSAGGWWIQPLRQGHASSLEALRHGAHGISSNQFPICVVGGVDTLVDSDALLWIDSQDRLASDRVRSGFPPGEGAGFAVLAGNELRVQLGLPSLGRVRGVASNVEPKLHARDEVCLGEGLTAAIRGATVNLEPQHLVSDVYCDINGERYRTEEWGFALLRVQELLGRTSYVSAVGEWGDVGAASGVLQTILAVQAWARGYANGDLALVWSSSDDGLRSAATLERPGA